MREKLIELLIAAQDLIALSRKADFLIANDVVPVVRCKDCKWWKDDMCTNVNGANCLVMNGDWFCCSGERRTK